jgi:hypothetical protein
MTLKTEAKLCLYEGEIERRGSRFPQKFLLAGDEELPRDKEN